MAYSSNHRRTYPYNVGDCPEASPEPSSRPKSTPMVHAYALELDSGVDCLDDALQSAFIERQDVPVSPSVYGNRSVRKARNLFDRQSITVVSADEGFATRGTDIDSEKTFQAGSPSMGLEKFPDLVPGWHGVCRSVPGRYDRRAGVGESQDPSECFKVKGFELFICERKEP